MFRDHHPDATAQAILLASLTRTLPPHLALTGEGPAGDGLLTLRELKHALANARRGSSPGWDGLPYEFYRAFGDHLLPVILAVANAAFQDTSTTSPLAALLKGVICLLLKPSKPPLELSSYRPITLLNADVKLIMLVMSNRLQRPLEYLIDVTQSAFLVGRDICDNVRYHLCLVSRLQELGLPAWLLNSDIDKAYDSVDRSWLQRCMTTMGFKEQGLIRWTQILLAGSTDVIRVNGFFTEPFPVRRSLAQGSSVSCQEWAIVLQPCVSYLESLRA
jgi:hypothetical protein